jgi:hypothetical protein
MGWRTVRDHPGHGPSLVDAEAIVLGRRGLTGVKSLLLGSVSHAVLQHADRPVVVVPSPAVTEARAQRRHDAPPRRPEPVRALAPAM